MNQMPVQPQPGTKIVLKYNPGNNGVIVSGVCNNGAIEKNVTVGSQLNKPTAPFMYILNTPTTSTCSTNKSSASGSSATAANSIAPNCDVVTIKKEPSNKSPEHQQTLVGRNVNEQKNNNHLTSQNNRSVVSKPIVVNVYDSSLGSGAEDQIGGLCSNSAAEDVEEDNYCTSSKAECKIEITLRNVVCTFNTRCHLNLREITQSGTNVIFKSAQNLLEMKIRHPKCTAFLFSSGKITCTGSNSEENARLAARKYAYYLKRRGYQVKFCSYRVVNVMATCAMPFTVRLADFARAFPKISSYEPEINPGVTCRFADIKASLKVFASGKVTVTAPSSAAAEKAIQMIYPLVYHYKRDDIVPDIYDFEIEMEENEDFDEVYDDSDDDGDI